MPRLKEFCVKKALESAMEAFREHGYEGTSLSQLTAKMGIQKASLYDTFGGKRQLFLQALIAYQACTTAFVQDLVATSESPRVTLKTFLMAASPCPNHPSQSCLSISAAVELGGQDPEVTMLMEQHRNELAGLLAGLISKGQSLGDFRMDFAPAEGANLVVTTFFGIHLAGKTGMGCCQLERIVELFLQSLSPSAPVR